jgi:hypothetical protein
MATEKKNKQIQYELYIPAQFDDSCRGSLEVLMEHKLTDVGAVHEGESVTKENGEIDHCVLRFSMEEGPELVEEIITSLDELGVPYGSKLYHDGKVVAELGTLHHVRVNLDGSLGDKKQFKRLDAKITKALEDNSIVSAVFFNLSEDVAVFTYYVADKDLAIGVIEAYLHRSALGKGATIDVVDSGLTIHERYMSDISRVYRGLVPDLWTVIQSEWKGVSSKEWMDLLRRYPNTPEGLSFLLNVVNGTYQKEYTSLKVTFPMCMYDDKQFYLLSARQMLEFDLHGREVMNMDILGTDTKPSQVRASSKQRDLCLFAATGEGEQASRLYIDYNPTKSGHVGQVLYFNGEDHTVTVLASSFGEALLVLMKQESGNFGDYLIQTIMEKTMNLDVDTMDIQRADTQLLIDAMTNLAEKIMEQGAIGPMVGKRGFMGMVLLDNAEFDVNRFKKDLLTKWDIESITSPEGMKVRAAIATKDVDTVEEEDMEEAHFLVIDDYKVVVAPFSFAMPMEAVMQGATRNYLWEEALDAVINHTGHVAISIVEGPGNPLEEGILLTKLLSVATEQTGASAIYTNGVLYEAKKYHEETEQLRDDMLPMANLIWVDMEFEDDDTISLHTSGMELFKQLNVEFLHCPWHPEKAWNYVLSVADYVLTSDKTVQDGDSVGRTEEEQLTVHIDGPVHADGVQSIQIFFDENETE